MSMNVFKTQPHLKPQDAKTVDPSKLTALTPEVVREQCFLHIFSFQLCAVVDNLT